MSVGLLTSFQVAVVDRLRPSSFFLRLGPLRVGLRVPALSQGTPPIGALDTGHRELPLTVSRSWGDWSGWARPKAAGLVRGVEAGSWS